MKDFFHKIICPSTHECNFYAVSFNNVEIQPNWMHIVKNLPIPSVFLHRDNFLKLVPNPPPTCPEVYLEQDNQLKNLISVGEMNDLQERRN